MLPPSDMLLGSASSVTTFADFDIFLRSGPDGTRDGDVRHGTELSQMRAHRVEQPCADDVVRLRRKSIETSARRSRDPPPIG
jgi:hypothetical protein